MNRFIPVYIDALCQEIIQVSTNAPEPIHVGTLFFGGGTPSLLSVPLVEKVLESVRENFVLNEQIEFTLEANPGTVSAAQLKELKLIGVNRISFGMQSAHPDDLRTLDRDHTYEDVVRSIFWSKQAGFEHLNLDLIFGIPGQTLERWKRTLDLALRLDIDHFSLYSLSIEDGTPLKRWIDHGIQVTPDDDLAAEMYEYAMVSLDGFGYEQYEISNWARKMERGRDARCKHNLQYWRYLPYLGFGAGAHGFYDGIRTENEGLIGKYLLRMKNVELEGFPESSACISAKLLSKWDQMQEFLMVGFRLTDEGISKSGFEMRFGHDPLLVFKEQFSELMKLGLIENHPLDLDRVRLTTKGKLFGNRVFMQFVGNHPAVGFEI
jgi:oxygen-independent coproporphyrinogen III oxidase